MALVSPRDGVSGGPSWGCLLALLSLLCATRETLVVARTAGRALAQTAVLPYELVNRNPEVFPFEYYTITDNDLRYAAGRSGDPEIIYRVTYVFGGSWLLLGGTPLVGGSVFKQSDINERRLAILFDNKPNTYMCGFAFTVAFSNDDGRHIQGSFAAQVNSFTSLSSIKLGLGYVLDFTAYLSYPIEPFPAAVDSKGQYVTGSVLMQFKMEYKEHIARSIGGNMHADDVSVNSLGRTHGFRAFGSEHWIGTSVKCPSEEVENMFRFISNAMQVPGSIFNSSFFNAINANVYNIKIQQKMQVPVGVSSSTDSLLALTLGSSCAAVTLMAISIIGFWFCKYKRCRISPSMTARQTSVGLLAAAHLQPQEIRRELNGRFAGTRVFTYHSLSIATLGFSENRVIGTGKFGQVYRGQLRCGWQVAVKRLQGLKNARGGWNGIRQQPLGNKISLPVQADIEFETEIRSMMGCKHPNLLEMLGFCSEGEHRLIVLELMGGGCLSDILAAGGFSLEWIKRLQIAIGVARGMAYLHAKDPPIVNGDLKSSNILLDVAGRACISDFGISCLCKGEDRILTGANATTRLVETHGYRAPECINTGNLTRKGDVYSFGVVLLELMTGLAAVDTNRIAQQRNLVLWLQDSIQAGDATAVSAVAPDTASQWPENILTALIEMVRSCIAESPSDRPDFEDLSRKLQLLWVNFQMKDEKDRSPEDERRLCLICMDNVRNQMLEPCHHIVACEGCAVQLKECPVCRTLATGVNKKEFLGRTYAYYDVEEISRASSSIFHDATESFTTISVPTLTIPGGTDIVNRVQERPIPWAPPTYVLDLQ